MSILSRNGTDETAWRGSFNSYFCSPRSNADVRQIKHYTEPCQCSVASRASLLWTAEVTRLHPCRSLSFRTHPKMPEGVYSATRAATFVLATCHSSNAFSTLCSAEGGEVRALFASFDFQSARREAEESVDRNWGSAASCLFSVSTVPAGDDRQLWDSGQRFLAVVGSPGLV